jgi:hypothetical protein
MSAAHPALQPLLLTFASWVNRHQQHAIEYLVEENRVLREQVGSKRLRLTDDQRRRLAANGAKPERARRLAGGRQCALIATHIDMPDVVKRAAYEKWRF